MYRCERCGSSFTTKEAKGAARCPACLDRDGISSPLTLTLLSAEGHGPTALERCRRAARALGRPPRVTRGEGP